MASVTIFGDKLDCNAIISLFLIIFELVTRQYIAQTVFLPISVYFKMQADVKSLMFRRKSLKIGSQRFKIPDSCKYKASQ